MRVVRIEDDLTLNWNSRSRLRGTCTSLVHYLVWDLFLFYRRKRRIAMVLLFVLYKQTCFVLAL